VSGVRVAFPSSRGGSLLLAGSLAGCGRLGSGCSCRGPFDSVHRAGSSLFGRGACRMAFARSLSRSVHRAGSSPRRASNFSLLRQRKVTKREALNRKSPLAAEGHRAKTTAQSLSRSDPLRSRCCACHQPDSSTVRAPNVGCTPNSRVECKRRRRRVAASGVFADEFGVQPTLNVVKARVLTLVLGGRRERSGSLLRSGRAGVFAREPRHQSAGVRFSASSLVTFFWRSRRKLLARRGELPARCTERLRLQAKATSQEPHP
jgi:hypothetical protein